MPPSFIICLITAFWKPWKVGKLEGEDEGELDEEWGEGEVVEGVSLGNPQAISASFSPSAKTQLNFKMICMGLGASIQVRRQASDISRVTLAQEICMLHYYIYTKQAGGQRRGATGLRKVMKEMFQSVSQGVYAVDEILCSSSSSSQHPTLGLDAILDTLA